MGRRQTAVGARSNLFIAVVQKRERPPQVFGIAPGILKGLIVRRVTQLIWTQTRGMIRIDRHDFKIPSLHVFHQGLQALLNTMRDRTVRSGKQHHQHLRLLEVSKGVALAIHAWKIKGRCWLTDLQMLESSRQFLLRGYVERESKT